MTETICSFCGTAMPTEQAKNHFVAGPKVIICRGCVEMCIDIFSRDATWRDQQIVKLTELRSKPRNSN